MQADGPAHVHNRSELARPNPPSTEARVWLDVRGAAERTGVSDSTVLREARSGRLRGYRVGGRKLWRFRREDVDRWITG